MVEEAEEVARRIGQRGLAPGRPDARDDRDGVMSDEMVAEPLAGQELAVGREVLVLAAAQEGQGAPVEPGDLPQQPGEPRVDQAAWLGEDTAQAAAAGVLQAAPVAANAHAHLGGPRLDAQLREKLAQPGVRHVVVDDEPAVDGVPPAASVGDVMGVRVSPEPVLGFEQGDVVAAGEQVSGGKPGDPRADHGHGRARGAGAGISGDGPLGQAASETSGQQRWNSLSRFCLEFV